MLRAVAVCGLISSGYVAGLYLLSPSLDFSVRDTPRFIRRRLAAATVLTVLLVLLSPRLLPEHSSSSSTIAQALGCEADLSTVLSASGVVAVLMSLFYLGPLVTNASLLVLRFGHVVSEGGECVPRKSPWYSSATLQAVARLEMAHYSSALSSWCSSEQQLHQFARNLVVAPISEEIVFRAIMVAILYPACKSVQTVVLVAPLLFAPAHIHHALVKVYSGYAVRDAALESVAQLTYTYIFGAIATLLLLRTGTLAAPIVAHVICNYVQLPDLGFMSPPGRGGGGGQPLSALYGLRHALLAAHALGLVLFAVCIGPLTQPFKIQRG